MAKSSSKPANAPSSTGNKSGSGRGNNPPKNNSASKTARRKQEEWIVCNYSTPKK